MRWQQPVRIVASAPAELYKESCCPAGPAAFPSNFHTASAGRGGKSALAPRSRARPSRRSSEGQDRPPASPPAPSRVGQSRPPPACREGGRLGEVGVPGEVGGPRRGGCPGQVQRYGLAKRSSPAEPRGVWCLRAGAAHIWARGSAPAHRIRASPQPWLWQPPPALGAGWRDRLTPAGLYARCLPRSPLPNGSHRAAAEPDYFKEISAADPPFLLPLGRPGG